MHSESETAGSPAYDSPVRRARREATAERILAAAADIVRERPGWSWDNLTVSGVAERAGVGRRTVYRHFSSLAGLRGAVETYMSRNMSGLYRDVSIETLPDVAQNLYATLVDSAPPPWAVLPVAFPTIADERHDALRRLADIACAGAPAQVEPIAALLDVIWQVASFEILVCDWHLSPDDAHALLERLHDLVVADLASPRSIDTANPS